ncbi:Six-hairpin glycosidase-like protein [Ilyonectria robusta]|uniref:Six-hairpin glycosidase-like protein n=1 Tax=Ilyonectria robusta TaxID=1079257 RepID=UPI001E8ECF07|nr:Six-hairpin glycosidase-like protein [Ilyonectria robusta]KAH8680264.1 Six-hairpin glycosidase-like protein [Ilyonectria robusta]
MPHFLRSPWLLSQIALASGLTFNIPTTVPANASGQIPDAPVGVSLEFFAFPGYFNDVASTSKCLQNLKDVSGTWPPLRIGGTTQDRATYDASSSNAVTYTVASSGDAPSTLTFGPSFFDLAATYGGEVIIGLNRRLNNIANTVAAAKLAKSKMTNLDAIELGNEPNFFTSSDPIANGASWTPAADYASQVAWQDQVGGNLSATNIFSAGVYFYTSPMSIQGLSAVEGNANSYVKDYCSHNYPQSASTANLASLMSHSGITSQISSFAAEVSAAKAKGKSHVMGETNSATQGGGGISPTFGAALWILDYVLQLVHMGTKAIYFHQGTIGNCQYCWWGRYSMGAPYFGAYFATMALADADQIAPLDDQTTAYAGYAIYKSGVPVKVLLYNSDYYTSGTRPSQTFTLTGLSSSRVTAKRLTAPFSTSRVDRGSNPTVAGQTFTINQLQANWIWTPNWIDSSTKNTAGQLVAFTREFTLQSAPTRALLNFSADTRYKLYVNGVRVAVGPARSSLLIWYYDTLDIAPFLKQGVNKIKFLVIRYYASSRTAMPFERTALPGLTVIGSVEADAEAVDLSSGQGWRAQVDESVLFPIGLVDDVFLHINERIAPTTPTPSVTPIVHGIRTLNGDLAPWRLRPRCIPVPEESKVDVDIVRACQSTVAATDWTACLSGKQTLILPGGSSHTLDLQATVHSTAFLRWTFQAGKRSHVKLKVTYSEGYELEPRSYPFFRTKADRLDAATGHLIGPYDDVVLDIPESQTVVYEPFWFRTFRLLRLEITTGPEPVELLSFDATQVNYPLAVKASWDEPGDVQSKDIWDVSIRTMRNCMFDGYSDCPFYEQLQYSGDSRAVGLFHYLLSGDDRLMRQAITNFASSIGVEGLTHSRFPSHVPQLIAGFSLLWALQVCDHHVFFGDTRYARSFLPRIDGVLEFFDAHVDSLGLVSNLPEDVWQYVDWVTTWGATDEHPDKGVPTSGRKSNRHTYFSMLYAYTLQQVAGLLRAVGRPGNAEEYESRAASLLSAIRTHCYDGRFFTDSTADIADDLAYSQHCQVFAILCGAALPEDRARLVTEAFAKPHFSKCSYMMQFYALRAFSLAGDDVYEAYWAHVWDPWRKMLANNLSTWEEDDVRQRSDCHAWGSVPVYEYCTELAGIRSLAPGFQRVLFKPRLRLSESVSAKVAMGRDNLATVSWKTGAGGVVSVVLQLERAVEVTSQLPGGKEEDHGVISQLTLEYKKGV